MHIIVTVIAIHSLAEIPNESKDKFSLFREVLGVTLIERWSL